MITHDLERKMRHTLAFTHMFINYPGISFKEIAQIYNKTNFYNEKVDENYVYECLTSKEDYDLLMNNLWSQISDRLERRKIQNEIIDVYASKGTNKK